MFPKNFSEFRFSSNFFLIYAFFQKFLLKIFFLNIFRVSFIKDLFSKQFLWLEKSAG